MAYVPTNILVYTAAYCGALAGMGMSDKNPNKKAMVMTATGGWGATVKPAPLTSQAAAVSTDFTSLVAVVGAFAQEFDTLWAGASASDFQLNAIQLTCASAWEERAPLSSDPTKYRDICATIIAAILAGSTFFNDQNLATVPAAPPTVAAGGGIAPGLSQGMVLTVQSDGSLAWQKPSTITPSPAMYAKQAAIDAPLQNTTVGMQFWIIQDKSLIGARIYNQFAGGGTRDISVLLWPTGGGGVPTARATKFAVPSGAIVDINFAAPVALAASPPTIANTPGKSFVLGVYYELTGGGLGETLAAIGMVAGFPGPLPPDGAGARSINSGGWILPDVAFQNWLRGAGGALDALPNNILTNVFTFGLEPVFA